MRTIAECLSTSMLVLVLGVNLLLACTGSTGRTVYVRQYLVREDMPQSPTFTVMPASAGRDDLAAAERVAGFVIGCGLTVLQRPKFIGESYQVDGTVSGGSTAAAGTPGEFLIASSVGTGTIEGSVSTSEDIVEMLDRTDADYVVFTRDVGENYFLQIVNRATKRVLFSGAYSPVYRAKSHPPPGTPDFSEPQSPEERMRDLLVKLGAIPSSEPVLKYRFR